MARGKTSEVVRTGLPLLEGGQRVRAEPQAERLQPDDTGGGDVAKVHVRPDPGDQVGLQRRGGRLDEQLLHSDASRQHVLDQAVPELAVRPADAGAAALPGLERHQRGAGVQVLGDRRDPLARRLHLRAAGVLETDLGHDGEVARELADVAGLLGVGHVNRAVGHLDVRAGVVLAEPPEVLELPLQDELLEQRAAEVVADAVLVEHADLLAQAAGDQRGAPAELDEVDVLRAEFDEVAEQAERYTAVDHHGQAAGAGFDRPLGQCQRCQVHRFPPRGWEPNSGIRTTATLPTGRQVISSTATPFRYASRTRSVPPCATTSTSPPVSAGPGPAGPGPAGPVEASAPSRSPLRRAAR